MAVKAAVNKVIEDQRNAGNIGSSLQADVDLYFNDGMPLAYCKSLGEELRFALITSAATCQEHDRELHGVETEVPGLRVVVKKSPYHKCVRCWHYREDVGSHKGHEELCGRCVENVEGAGEVRRFA